MSILENEKATVLVVEDDNFMQAILSEYLGSRFKVEVVSNGIDAMGVLQKGLLPDLIISDL
ncbi:hypothetical protein ABTN34_17925, partial [Acinetobacter baumannii]